METGVLPKSTAPSVDCGLLHLLVLSHFFLQLGKPEDMHRDFELLHRTALGLEVQLVPSWRREVHVWISIAVRLCVQLVVTDNRTFVYMEKCADLGSFCRF